MTVVLTIDRVVIGCTTVVWLVNGLFGKVLGLIPRHQAIVARILGADHALITTKAIGVAEVGMAIWVASGYARHTNAVLQVAIIAAMNILEFVLAPDLLLWGRLNAVFAVIFIAVILGNEVHLGRGRPASREGIT